MAELCQRAPTRHSCRLPPPPFLSSWQTSASPLLGRKRAPPGGHRGAGGGALGYIRDLPQSNGTIIAFYRNLVVHFKRFSSSPLPLRPPLRGLGLEMDSRLPFGSPSWVEGEERLPSALGARPWSLRHLPPDASCDICATDSRLSSLTSRDSEGDFVWEDGSFLRPTRGSPSAARPLLASARGPNPPENRPPGSSRQRWPRRRERALRISSSSIAPRR